jgi:hypothetical protein
VRQGGGRQARNKASDGRQEEERVRACRVQQWQALVMRVFVRASLCRLACGRQVMQPARQKARGHSNLRDEVRSMLECR